MVPAAADVLIDKLLDSLRTNRPRSRLRRSSKTSLSSGASSPRNQWSSGTAEAHLAPPLDRRWQEIGKGLDQDLFPPAARIFHSIGMPAARSTTS